MTKKSFPSIIPPTLRRPHPYPAAGRFAVLLCLFSGLVAAQTQEVRSAPSVSSLYAQAALKLRYGVSLRTGGQQDLGPGLTYDGMTPNDVAVAADWFPLQHFGIGAQVQREGFALFDGGDRVTGGGLIRAQLGPVGRIAFGPLLLEGQVGYAFAQLPIFGSSAQPEFAAGQRHAVLLASRIALELPLGIMADARGEYPLAISAVDAGGAKATSTRGFAAGASVSAPLYRQNGVEGRIGLEYQYVDDRFVAADGASSSQQLSRVGAALQIALVPHAPDRPRFGGLRFLVLDAASGLPLDGAEIALTIDGEAPRALTTVAGGSVEAPELPLGPVLAKVSVGGYVPSEVRAEVQPSTTTPVEIRIRKEAPKVGGVSVSVLDKETQAPVVGAVVKVGDAEQTTDAEGRVVFAGMTPGAVGIRIDAAGYQAGEEAVQVVAGSEAQVPVLLVKAEKKVPATITGFVRTRAGQPIRAKLEIPELGQQASASEKGAFLFTVPGGAYRVIISAPGYRSQVKRVSVKDGDQAIFNVDLHPGR